MWFVKFSLKRVIIFPFQLCSFFSSISFSKAIIWCNAIFMWLCFVFNNSKEIQTKREKVFIAFQKGKKGKKNLYKKVRLFICLFVSYKTNINQWFLWMKILFNWKLHLSDFLFEQVSCLSLLIFRFYSCCWLQLHICICLCVYVIVFNASPLILSPTYVCVYIFFYFVKNCV